MGTLAKVLRRILRSSRPHFRRDFKQSSLKDRKPVWLLLLHLAWWFFHGTGSACLQKISQLSHLTTWDIHNPGYSSETLGREANVFVGFFALSFGEEVKTAFERMSCMRIKTGGEGDLFKWEKQAASKLQWNVFKKNKSVFLVHSWLWSYWLSLINYRHISLTLLTASQNSLLKNTLHNWVENTVILKEPL